MISEQKNISENIDKKEAEIKNVKAFVNKTRIQNEALKKIILRLNNSEATKNNTNNKK